MARTTFLPNHPSLTSYYGIIPYQQHTFFIQLTNVQLTSPLPLQYAGFTAENTLAQVLESTNAIQDLQTRMQQATSLETFGIELQRLLQQYSSSLLTHTQPMGLGNMKFADFFKRIVQELDSMDWKGLLNLNQELDTLTFEIFDVKNRQHQFDIRLSPDYPKTPPECVVDAPLPFVLRWDRETSSFRTIFDQIGAYLLQYQEFWDIMDDLDDGTWVLEPENPSRASTTRRLAINKHCSIQVQIDPTTPRNLCQVAFFGPDHMVAPFRAKFMEKKIFDTWNTTITVRRNLEHILDIHFPPRVQSHEQNFLVECGICYCYRLELPEPSREFSEKVPSTIPDCVCENVKCSRPFHNTCLLEWLRALPNSHQSFNKIFGSCPYCQENISASNSHQDSNNRVL